MKRNEQILSTEEKALFALRALYETYGYNQFRMSKFEEYELYVRNKNFLVSDHIITFTDTSGKLMALKPDVTLSIVKNSRDIPGCVQKVYYDENVYRVSGKSGSYKEILQAGLECLGEIDDYCISEVLLLAVKSLSLISDDFVLDVSHLGIVSALVERLGVTPEGSKAILRCVGEKNIHGIEEVCRNEAVPSDCAEVLKQLIRCYGTPERVFAELEEILPDEETRMMAKQFSQILSVLPQDRIRVDFSVVHDMNYYNGIVFKGFVKDLPTGVLSGGQYDRLMKKLKKRAGAIGFAVYLDLLEELSGLSEEFDVDVLLLYSEEDSVDAVSHEIDRLIREGKSVSAQRAIPDNLRYRELLRFHKEEEENRA